MFSHQHLDLITAGLSAQSYCILDEGIALSLCAGLRTALSDQTTSESMTRAGVGRGNDFAVDDFIRRDKIRWISPDSPAESAWLAQMEGLRLHLNRQLFLGLKSFESHFALYENGDFYQKHRDAFRGSASRFVSVVTYLTESWDASDGGELVLYDSQDEERVLERVVPEPQKVVVFLSEDLPHEVLVSHRSRMSIAGWFRV